MPQPVRSWEPRETRLLGEWSLRNYPGQRVVYRARLGPLSDNPIYKSVSRYADALIFTDSGVIIVEAKLDSDLGAVAQLEHYAQLFRQTPDYIDYWTKPIKLILLVARQREDVTQFAAAKGIAVILFFPDWVQDYFSERVLKYRRATP
jgi:hypothetical protein